MAGSAGEVIRFGAVYALTVPPVREGSLWSHIAVVNRPGVPFVFDEHCAVGTIYYLAPEALTCEGVEAWLKTRESGA